MNLGSAGCVGRSFTVKSPHPWKARKLNVSDFIGCGTQIAPPFSSRGGAIWVPHPVLTAEPINVSMHMSPVASIVSAKPTILKASKSNLRVHTSVINNRYIIWLYKF